MSNVDFMMSWLSLADIMRMGEPPCTNNNAMHWAENGIGPEICPLFDLSGFGMHISLSWRSII